MLHPPLQVIWDHVTEFWPMDVGRSDINHFPYIGLRSCMIFQFSLPFGRTMESFVFQIE